MPLAAVRESACGTLRRIAATQQIRELSEAQRTCRELVGRVDPTLLTHC
jgi:hypothetical protein